MSDGTIDVNAANARTAREVFVRTLTQKWAKYPTDSNSVWEARFDNAIGEAYGLFQELADLVTAKPGHIVGELQLTRKDVWNDCFGWWFVKVHDGRRPAAEGFISLPNLMIEVVRRTGGAL